MMLWRNTVSLEREAERPVWDKVGEACGPEWVGVNKPSGCLGKESEGGIRAVVRGLSIADLCQPVSPEGVKIIPAGKDGVECCIAYYDYSFSSAFCNIQIARGSHFTYKTL